MTADFPLGWLREQQVGEATMGRRGVVRFDRHIYEMLLGFLPAIPNRGGCRYEMRSWSAGRGRSAGGLGV